jgi:subtilisin family serine protease
MSDLREFFEQLVYHSASRRFTQQSPVMPDVWIRFGTQPGRQQELLMVPDWNHTTAELASAMKARIAADEEFQGAAVYRHANGDTDTGPASDEELPAAPRPPGIAHNQNVVVATLWFDQLVRSVLPLSAWWQRSVAGVVKRSDRDRLAEGLRDPEGLVGWIVAEWDEDNRDDAFGPDVLWVARVVGVLAFLSTDEGAALMDGLERDDDKVRAIRRMMKEEPQKLAWALVRLLEDIDPVRWGDDVTLYSVNLNRHTSQALERSGASVKADAVRRLFQLGGRDVRWAVIDSGIDATHPAFRRRAEDGTPMRRPFGRRRQAGRRRGGSKETYRNQTRILATYDFVHIRDLLGADPDDLDHLAELYPAVKDGTKKRELAEFLRTAEEHVIDWQRLEPFLRVEHKPGAYRPPPHPHGTHVAGIIGADWRASDGDAGLDTPPRGEDLVGVSPEIQLYDLRVLDDKGNGNEFAIMSAMQFARDLNSRRDFVAVHGVNLSFSIDHDVANYACGRTPVCEEAERLVGSGIVAVAAAGNSGRARYLTPANTLDEGFRTVSITDPGNAQAVITVGATHRSDPHTYGVSYFSSRGPTGDGRLKPDLVAPGEKIRSAVPGGGEDRLDGTSMAAPHVSGAAALILSRHPEFIGKPAKLKEILCSTATDLGRERYFQGAGLLDILRALQSI